MTDQELNEVVARKLGYHKCKNCDWGYGPDGTCNTSLHQHLSDYCNSIQAAWEVVEAIPLALHLSLFRAPNNYWTCEIINQKNGDSIPIFQIADTAARAICEAFLKLEGDST